MITGKAPILRNWDEIHDISEGKFDENDLKKKYQEGFEIPWGISFELLEVLFYCLRFKIKARRLLKEILELDFF